MIGRTQATPIARCPLLAAPRFLKVFVVVSQYLERKVQSGGKPVPENGPGRSGADPRSEGL